MIWVRKLLLSSFSGLLLLGLVGGVVSYALNAAFSTPVKVEQWLGQSHLYEYFVASGVNQLNSMNNTGAGQMASVNANDPVVEQAIRDSFPKQLMVRSIDTFLGANYAWLQGKTAKPEFRIDLTASKTAFAQQVSQSVAGHLAAVPSCTVQQLAQLDTTDLLHIICRPVGVNPGVAASLIEQQIITNGNLANPIVTADSLNPPKPGGTISKPYYRAVSMLPKIYRIAQKLPLAFAGVALISLTVLYMALPTRRSAWRLLARVLVMASILLSIGRLVFDIIYNKLEDRVSNTTAGGQLQQPLSDFAHQAINYITHLDLLGALGYLSLATVIIFGLLLTRRKRTWTKSSDDDLQAEPQPLVEAGPLLHGAEQGEHNDKGSI